MSIVNTFKRVTETNCLQKNEPGNDLASLNVVIQQDCGL